MDYSTLEGATNLTVLYVTSNLTEEGPSSDDLLINVVGVYITGISCLLGLAGNVLSFIVLLRAHGRSPMFFVLRAVAISDAIFLLMVFLLSTVVNLYTSTGHLYYASYYRPYIQFALWPVLMMTQMTTVWLTVLVSVERYVAICWPLRASSVCTMSNVQKCVTIIYAFSFLYNIPRYLEFQVSENLMTKSDIGKNLIYRYLYTCTLYSLLLFFVPLFLLIFLNMRLIMALNRGKKQWNTLQFRQKKEQNLTAIPLTIVLVFFVCGTPALVCNVLDAVRPSLFAQRGFIVFMVTSNLLVVLNSAVNFIIYCFLGKKFRQKLVEMLDCLKCCRKYASVSTFAPPSSNISKV